MSVDTTNVTDVTNAKPKTKELKTHITLLLCLLLVAGCRNGSKQSYDKLGASGMTERTENLAANLPRFASQGVMIGQWYATVRGVGWQCDSVGAETHETRSDINSICNDHPIVTACELAGIEEGRDRNVDGIRFDVIRQDILAMSRRGGLTLLFWTMPRPASKKSEEEYIKAAAEYLSSLSDGYGIKAPVCLVPLPLDKPDRWYAQLQPQEYSALHASLTKRLRAAGVTNAVFGYSCRAMPTLDEFLSRYPRSGVSVVNLHALAPEATDTAHYAKTLASAIDILAEVASLKQVAAGVTAGIANSLTDTFFSDTLLPLVTHPGISYAVFGPNSGEPSSHTAYVPYPGSGGIDGFMKLYNHPRTLFAHDVNGLYLKKEQAAERN